MTDPACVMCGKYGRGGPLLIAELETTRAFLHEDQFFPGYVLLVLRRHATELFELPVGERGAHLEEVSRVAEAIARALRPVKMNYELLGNQVPHIHWHLVPRLADDPEPRWPVWRVAHDPKPLPTGEAARRIAQIRSALG